jgi:hypothetical protein
VLGDDSESKSVAILIHDPWRWGLAEDGEMDFLDGFYSRLVRWLAVRRDIRRVSISVDKEIYSTNEAVGYTVTVLNESLLPMDNAIVKVNLITGKDTMSVSALNSIGNGQYRGSLPTWSEGEYRLQVDAYQDEELVGKDEKRFIVEPFSIELLDMQLNDELMKDIAEFSGGFYVHSEKSDSLFKSLDFPPSTKALTNTLQFADRGWFLLLIIVLLSLEWFIRMRTGML